MAADTCRTFGELLRRYRTDAGLTQQELAERAALSARGIADLERGARTAPYPETTRRLADALQLGEHARANLLSARTQAQIRSRNPSRPGGQADAATGWPVNWQQRLPPQPGRLIGRDEDCAEILDILRRPSVRLVTLVGAGGAGKTRVALDVAYRVAPEFSDGVVFVDLAPVSDPDLVVPTIGHALGLHAAPVGSVMTEVKNALHNRHLLLLLDNFEHVSSNSPSIAELLDTCADLKVLVTSREALRLRLENVIYLAPLPVPELGAILSTEALLRNPAVDLFFERARAVRSDFSPLSGSESVRTVAEICVRLDGLPLAIELAAAWVRVLDLREIMQRLGGRFDLLVSGPKDAPTRHQTLRSALDWSYALLKPDEQVLLRRLSVFAGGWTLAAAESVCATSPHPGKPAPEPAQTDIQTDASRVLYDLASLVDKSLVVVESVTDGSARYRMLETIRQYAADLLFAHDEAELIRSHHAEYFLALADTGGLQLVWGPSQSMWLDIFEREHDNLRAALRYAGRQPSSVLELRLAGALGHFWTMRGYVREGRQWLESALTRDTDAPARIRAKAASYASLMALLQNDMPGATAWRDEALRRAEQSLYPAEAPLSVVFMTSGLVARGEREYHQALALFDAAIAYVEGSLVGKAPPIVSYQKAATLLRLGEIDRSEALLRDTLAEALAQGEKYGASACLGELGLIALLRSNPKQALAEFHHALALASELGQVLETSYWLMALAAVAGTQGRLERVASLLGTASTLCNRSGIPLNIPEYLKPRPLAGALDIPRLLARTRASLPEPAFDDAWQAGVARSVADVVLNPFHTAEDSRTVQRARKVRRVGG